MKKNVKPFLHPCQ